MRRRTTLLALPAALAGATARTAVAQPAAAAAAPHAPLRVVASFTILADLVRQVAGHRAAVRAVAGPDADAHAFQPRPSDAEALRGAALLVRNGLGFDAWFDRLARGALPAGARPPVLVTATEGIEPRTMEGHGHGGGGGGAGRRVPDPHAWQDVGLARRYVRAIAAGLAAADPGRAAEHRAGADTYDARLAALDAWVRAQVATVPPDRRTVVTAHDAFGYLGAAYGIRVLAAQGVSSAAEPSAAEVARLIRQVRAERAAAVFVESAATPAVLERLAREAGVRVRGGRLFADALSGPDGPAPTYEAMVRHNLGLLVPAMREEGS